MIDHKRLSEMKADFGAEELALIIAAFLAEATTAIAALREGWADEKVRRERLHFLKGCARTIGANRLGDMCDRFENQASGPEAVRALEQELALLREALQPATLRETG